MRRFLLPWFVNECVHLSTLCEYVAKGEFGGTGKER